jgi:hypothetical protein
MDKGVEEALRSLGQLLGANVKIRDQFEIIILTLSEDLKRLDERAGCSDAKLLELNEKVKELEMRVMAQQLANLALRTKRRDEDRLSKSDFL